MFHLSLYRCEGGSNIGDKGPAGLDEFKRQHKCNSICQKIGLKPIVTISTPESAQASASKSVST
jgi:hypothetical protein